MTSDNSWMSCALREAERAASCDEVPVGAVIIHDNQVIARGHNRREADRDPLAHAEVLAIRAAASQLDRWRLHGCTLYVTLEPCPMCAGAIVNARLDRVVFGASDPRAGAVGSLMDIVRHQRLNHRAAVQAGVLADEAAALLKAFFSRRR